MLAMMAMMAMLAMPDGWVYTVEDAFEDRKQLSTDERGHQWTPMDTDVNEKRML